MGKTGEDATRTLNELLPPAPQLALVTHQPHPLRDGVLPNLLLLSRHHPRTVEYKLEEANEVNVLWMGMMTMINMATAEAEAIVYFF